MRISFLIALFGVFSAIIAPAAAPTKFDPAARARVIAPLVDEQTFAVLRLDVTRIAGSPLFQRIVAWFPDAPPDLRPQGAVEKAFEKLSRAGVTDFYAVFTLSLGPPRQFGFTAVPLRPGTDEAAILACMPGVPSPHLRVGDMLIQCDRKETLERIAKTKPDPRPDLVAAFEAAGDTTAQVLLLPPAYARRVIEETMPELPKEIGRGPSTVLTRGILWAAAGIDLPPKTSIRLAVESQDAQAAEALRAKWADVFRLLGDRKGIRGVVPNFDRVASLLTPKVAGDRLILTLTDENQAIGTLCSAWTPLSATATEGARRSQSVQNLKQLALAMHNYHDVQKCFPPPATCNPEGKPLLSWRVLILPYVEAGELYKQFHLNEPWDSPHNRTLIEKMPPVYRCPGSKLKEIGRTNYVVPVGPETVFFGRKGTPLKDITDGVSNTIMIVECDDQRAPIWTKPDDLPFDPKNPAQGLGRLFAPGGFDAAFCDGSVRFLLPSMPADALRAMFTKAGGEPVSE